MKVVSDADLIGGTTPNESMVITEKNVWKIREKYLDEYFNDLLGKNKDALTKEEQNSAKALAFNEEVYLINKDRPEVLNRIFTKEEQAVIESRLSTERAINDSKGVSKSFVGLGEGMPDYVRYLISKSLDKWAKPSDLQFDFWGTGMRQYKSHADAIKDATLAKKIKQAGQW
jgi:hypothetical protein